MYRLLNINRTGLRAIETKVDSLADNLSNIETYGYKAKDVTFQELLTNQVHNNDVLLSGNVNHSRINAGSKSSLTGINFQQGNITPSTGDFHLAIEGDGFFGVYDRDGNLMLTRNGGFHINADKTITDDNGNPLSMELYVPFDQWEVSQVKISNNGLITTNINGEPIELGRVILYRSEVLDSLAPLGEGRYMPAANLPLYNSLESDNFGQIIQHALEASNVELAKSMTELIIAQRAYSFNAKSLENTDEIMSLINNIKR